MRQIAVELTQDTDGDGVIDQWGVGGMFFTALQESTGARLVEVKGKDVKLNISDPVFAKAAQYIYDLGQKGKYKCAKAFSHDNADLFLAGDVAMERWFSLAGDGDLSGTLEQRACGSCPVPQNG